MDQDNPALPRLRLDIGILAHNEERDLPEMLGDLCQQTLLADPAVDIQIYFLANGCSDNTVSVAQAEIDRMPADLARRFQVIDRAEPGKSRTMNWFLREHLRPEADLVMFVDSDIRLPMAGSMAHMVSEMRSRPELFVFTSRPVKDVVHNKTPLGPVGRLIAAGREGLTDYRRSIAGSLFVLRADFARRLYIPAGLPVEDGFIRGMILTEFLSQPEDFTRIDGHHDVFHLYESVLTPGALVRHQTRIVLGSAVNAAMYKRMRRIAPTAAKAITLLQEASENDSWLAQMLKEELPQAPYGYIPFRFLTKRLTVFRSRKSKSLRSALMLVPGLALDTIAWAWASLRMARGAGSGFW